MKKTMFTLFQLFLFFSVTTSSTLYAQCEPVCDNPNLNPQTELVSNVTLNGCTLDFVGTFPQACMSITISAVDICDQFSSPIQETFTGTQGNIQNLQFTFPSDGAYAVTWTVVLCSGQAFPAPPVTICVDDCSVCVTTEVLLDTDNDGIGDCPVGSYELCCDGSLTITGLLATTYIKINWSPICNAYNTPGDCNQTFPPQTVTTDSPFFLEFQSGNSYPPGCGVEVPAVFLLHEELANMDCLDMFDGAASEKNDDKNSLSKSEVHISPNPANNFVNISNPDAKNLNVEIYNTSGQRLLSQSVSQTTNTIDINTLAHGLYLVQIKNSDTQEFISTEKLIITK